MIIADLLGLEDLFLIEPSYDRLLDQGYTDDFIAMGPKELRVLIDQDERPLAVAGKTDKWYAIGLLHREPSDALIELVGEMDVELFQTTRAEFTLAVREYFSVLIAETVEPAQEDRSPERVKMVASLFKECFGKTKYKGRTCLDVGCGSGLGSEAIHSLGMKALSYDRDTSLLSRGLLSGRLFYHETMQLDATRASEYLEPVGYGMVLMAGKVTEFNGFLWRQIIGQTLSLSERTIITLETEKEARMVAPWCEGRKVEVFENERDPFYDRWVVLTK